MMKIMLNSYQELVMQCMSTSVGDTSKENCSWNFLIRDNVIISGEYIIMCENMVVLLMNYYVHEYTKKGPWKFLGRDWMGETINNDEKNIVDCIIWIEKLDHWGVHILIGQYFH